MGTHKGSGVTHYAVGTATVKVFFPNSRITCGGCFFCEKDFRVYKERLLCLLQPGFYVPNPDQILPSCPLTFEEAGENEEG